MVATITTAFGTLGADLLLVAAVGLGIGISVFGLRKGYKIAKGFVN